MILTYCYAKQKTKSTPPTVWLHSILDDENDTLIIRLKGCTSGEVILGNARKAFEKGEAKICISSFEDGIYRPKFLLSGTKYTAAPVLFENGKIIPTEAGADAVMALSDKYTRLLNKYDELLEKCRYLEEKIGAARSFELK